MSELPPPPKVIGTRVPYDHATYAREWPEKRETWVAPVHPEPIVRAQVIEFMPVWTKGTKRYPARIKSVTASVSMPDGALLFARAFLGLPGWTLRAQYAYGWDMNSDGTLASSNVMELTGEMTAGTDKTPPRPARRKVGTTVHGPVHSVMLCAHAWRTDGDLIRLQGWWIGDAFEEGRVSAPPGVPFALIGANELITWRDRAPSIAVRP